MKVEVYKVTSGKHEGEEFVHYSEGSYRKVEGGKINRYPYFSLEFNTLELVREIDHTFNKKVKVDFERISQCSLNKELTDKALVVALRIMKYETAFDQFDIHYSNHWDNTVREGSLMISHTNHGGMGSYIAEVGIDYVMGDIYVKHNRLHKDTIEGGRTVRAYEKYEHIRLGMKYKKPIDLSELSELQSMFK